MQFDGQVVAVKFMHRHLWTNPHSRHSFLREIDHASKINHSGVVKYLGWGQSPHGGPYLVCEYVDGQPLTHVKPNDSETSVQWLAQICQAVAAAHQAGVVHGDLTPNNILLDTTDESSLPISVSQPTRKNQQQMMLHLSLSHHLVERLALPLPSRFHLLRHDWLYYRYLRDRRISFLSAYRSKPS